MSYKCNCNERYNYIKKDTKKRRIISNIKYSQNCVGGVWKNVGSDRS